jgi:glycosyltransferase involved in cell wall biosynthesis
MKVLHLRQSSFLGSPEKLILLQSTLLRGEVECHIGILPDGDSGFEQAARGQGLPCHLFPQRGWFPRAAAHAVAQVMREHDIDLLCAHDYKSNLVGRWAAALTGRRAVAVFHGLTSHNAKGRFYEAVDRWVLRSMAGVVAVSEATRQKLSFLNGQVQVIRNAWAEPESPNFDRAAERQLRGLGASDVVFFTAGRLSIEKAQLDLISAFARVAAQRTDCRLIIAGDGPERSRLEAAAQATGVADRIQFLGFVPNLAPWYEMADVFVLSSLREGLPLVLLEAASHRLPVVSTSVGGVGEVIRDGENGLLVPPSNSERLYHALNRLASDARLRKVLGERNALVLKERFSPRKFADNYAAFFRRAVGPDMLWITWEEHRRTRNIAVALGLRLVEVIEKGSRWQRYATGVSRTWKIVHHERPKVVMVQCPSVALAALMLILRSIYRFKLVVDAHNEAVEPYNLQAGWYRRLIQLIHRRSDLIVVTNSALKTIVENNGGRAVVLPDRIPETPSNLSTVALKRPRLVFICSFAPDEPYMNVIEAAALVKNEIDVWITGNAQKAAASCQGRVTANVRFTGFLPEADYWMALRSATAIVDLTDMEDCLVCGAYESVAVGRPLITSDTRSLRSHFSAGTLYTSHAPLALADAFREAVRRNETLTDEMKKLREHLETDWTERAQALQQFLQEGRL